jgi:hypothetical protein
MFLKVQISQSKLNHLKKVRKVCKYRHIKLSCETMRELSYIGRMRVSDEMSKDEPSWNFSPC